MNAQGTATDRIEKTITMKAPPSRVWKAVADSAEFGSWFGVVFEKPFAEGEWISGTLTEPGWENIPFMIRLERIQPESEIAFRWHPFAVDPNIDYSDQPTTLVVFTITPMGDETTLTIVESGFDALPEPRRSDAYRANDDGWSEQAKRVAAYVTT